MTNKIENKTNIFEKIASFVVDRRNLFFFIYACLIIFSLFSMNWVKVENDITEYLSDETETKQGLKIMNDNFVTYGSARVMVSNVSYSKVLELVDEIENIDGIDAVDFDNTDKHFNNGSGLLDITFDEVAKDELSEQALLDVRNILNDYDYYIDSEISVDTAADLANEVKVIMVIAAGIIAVVLTLTSRSYAEVPVLILTFGLAAIINMGTNFLCGTISFISNSVTIVLQLALAIDYAIILCHRFSDEHVFLDAREACIVALSKAIPEIASSCLTTISGLAALAFMNFGIGLDLAVVLIKAIFCSLLSVFTFMPGLLVLFSNLIDKTKHKNLLPKITPVGKFAVLTKYIIPPVFVALIVVGCIFSNKCPYVYTYNELETANASEMQIAKSHIKNKFGSSNMLAVVVPKGNYDKERNILNEIEELDGVSKTMGLANIEALDGYMLADALDPREFSELADLDYEVANLLYSAYALNYDQYGELINGVSNYKVPLFDIFMFLNNEMNDGNIHLNSDIQDTLDDLFEQLEKAKLQLQSDNYSRMVVYLDLPEESEETFDCLDKIHEIIGKYYDGDFYVVGNSTSAVDLSSSFIKDNLLISILSAVFVVIILLFTFQSAGLPVLLITVIQGSIWINFSVPTIMNTPLYFLGYLVINAIQMGANIDYAIVISSHYSELRKSMPAKEAIIEALNSSFATIFTSGTILASAGIIICNITTNAVIASIGECLGRGTIISIILVFFVLPQMLLLGDTIIEKTSFKIESKLGKSIKQASGTFALNGRVRGYVSGIVDAEIKGLIAGEVNASIITKNANEKIEDIEEINTEVEVQK
ncbi:MAG: MMPL family transporter [Erysipelotrichaceae bacterium]|nr:MMPL family transporter [Erysipelotrichaceae bacterium]